MLYIFSELPEGNPGDDHGDPPGPGGDPNPGEPDDDNPDPKNPPSPPSIDNRRESDRFIEAIVQLSSSLRDLRRDPPPKSKKIKVREPDTEPDTFNHPQVLASNEKRILFILSYLKGSALSWFEP